MAKKQGVQTAINKRLLFGVSCQSDGCVHNNQRGYCEHSWEDISLDAQGRCIYRKLSDPLG